MTYDEIYNLWASSGGWLKNRIVVAIGHLATYHAGNKSASTDQIEFVKRVMPGTNALIEADFILWPVLTDATVLAKGDSVSDAELQAVVENWLNVLERIKAV